MHRKIHIIIYQAISSFYLKKRFEFNKKMDYFWWRNEKFRYLCLWLCSLVLQKNFFYPSRYSGSKKVCVLMIKEISLEYIAYKISRHKNDEIFIQRYACKFCSELDALFYDLSVVEMLFQQKYITLFSIVNCSIQDN